MQTTRRSSDEGKPIRRLTVNEKLWAVAILTVVIFTITVIGQHVAKRTALYDEKRLATKHVVEVAYGMLSYYEGEGTAGRLSLAVAKAQAATAIKGMRREGSEYLWVNDFTPRMVMRPQPRPKHRRSHSRQRVGRAEAGDGADQAGTGFRDHADLRVHHGAANRRRPDADAVEIESLMTAAELALINETSH